MTVKTEESDKTEEHVVQDALNKTGFGKFNLKILTICAFTNLNCCIGVCKVGLMVPSAACDFEMSTSAKGQLAMMPILGTVFGPYCWAAVAEMKGRNTSLIAALVIHAIGDVVGSFVSNYYGLLISQFVVGFGVSGQLALLFTYMGEFQPCVYRDRLLAWLELPWVCGLMIVTALGYSIIPLQFAYENSAIGFFFKSWNLFVLICALLSPILALLYASLPETPKYLAETGQHTELLSLLQDIYHSNTGNPREQYLEQLKSLERIGVNELMAKAQKRSFPVRKTLIQMAKQYFEQTKEIVQPPYLKTTILTVISSYTIISAYYSLTVWLPEIFQRYSIFEDILPGESATICTILEELYAANASMKIEDDFSNCTSQLDETVYFYNMASAAACLPLACLMPLLVDRFGYKFHLVSTALLGAAAAFSLFLVENSTQNLIVACIFEALVSVGVTIVLCVAVELYPTHLRVIAAAFTASVGRFGAFIGISTVGYLIDNHCVSLIILIGAHLVILGITAMFIPIKKSRAEFEKREKAKKQLKNDSDQR